METRNRAHTTTTTMRQRNWRCNKNMTVNGTELSLSSWRLWAPVSFPVPDCKNVRGAKTVDRCRTNLWQEKFSRLKTSIICGRVKISLSTAWRHTWAVNVWLYSSLYFGTRWRWVANLRFPSLRPPPASVKKASTIKEQSGWTSTRFRRFGEESNLLILPILESRIA